MSHPELRARRGDAYNLWMLQLLFILGLVLLPLTGRAQDSPVVEPVFHGLLEILPAGGTLDPETGSSTVKVRRWRFIATQDSNGLFPTTEAVVIALGDNTFTIPAGMVKASRNGRVFKFRAAPDADPRFPARFRLKQRTDGTWAVRFTLRGVNLASLVVTYPICLPMAVLVGDDDGFSGVELTRKSFGSRRLLIEKECDIGEDWPWL
jgi:hypothetical protein